MNNNLPALHFENFVQLPDEKHWQHRVEIKSETSNRIYVVSQHKENKHWGCSCPGWITHRNCKHLRTLGIPTGRHLPPYEPKIIE